MSGYSESDILKMLSNPETQRKAFGLVVDQYSEKMYWQIRRIVLSHDDANDVLQNALLKAWKNINTFQGDSKISTWLYRIAINESLDFTKRKKSIKTVATEGGTTEDSTVAAQLKADPYFDGNEAEALLQQAVAMLPDVQRTVFNMRYFDGMRYSQMSEILSTSEGALKASYHIAVKKISEFFHLRD